MCCWYKGILPDRRCASIHKKSVPIPHLHEYDLRKVSYEAEWVHLNNIKEADRNISAERVKRELYYHAMCTPCRNQVGCRGEMLNLKYLQRHCCICKSYYSTANDTALAVCTTCKDLSNKYEKLVSRGLKCIQNIIPNKIKNLHVRPAQKVSNYEVDIIITFESMSKRGIIVLEVDEGQHSSYNNKDERERAKNLINNIMKDAYEVKLNDPYRTPFKVLFLRMSPTGVYQIESYTSQNKMGTQYSIGERIVILRQWIIWFCLEFELVRDFTIMYMFHTQTKEACKKNTVMNMTGHSM
jgi:very-short-patch-repair endonuclease